jgi:hypothetical protein
MTPDPTAAAADTAPDRAAVSALEAAARERHWLAQEAAVQAELDAAPRTGSRAATPVASSPTPLADPAYRLIHRALQADAPPDLPPDFARQVAQAARRAQRPARQAFERWLPVWALAPFALAALVLFGLDGLAGLFTAGQRTLTGAPGPATQPLAWALCAAASLLVCALPWERWRR